LLKYVAKYMLLLYNGERSWFEIYTVTYKLSIGKWGNSDMQDRYAGDVGDFGKIGMLRCIEKSGIKVGVNWYLVGDESHNNDGKHIGYQKDKKFLDCDDDLLCRLNSMLEKGKRSVSELEKLDLINTGKYYHERLIESEVRDASVRIKWHQNALVAMQECDLVFLDPDNGMIPKSVGRGSRKSIKYVFPEEIIDYYKAGHSVVFYSHRTREQLNVYLKRFDKLFKADELADATIRGVSYKRGTVRDYFFILKEENVAAIDDSIAEMFAGEWSRHFERIEGLDR